MLYGSFIFNFILDHACSQLLFKNLLIYFQYFSGRGLISCLLRDSFPPSSSLSTSIPQAALYFQAPTHVWPGCRAPGPARRGAPKPGGLDDGQEAPISFRSLISYSRFSGDSFRRKAMPTVLSHISGAETVISGIKRDKIGIRVPWEPFLFAH